MELLFGQRVCLLVCAMRQVAIIKTPNPTSYPYAAIDQQTGEGLLRLTDRDELIALCRRLGWTIHEESSKSADEARQRSALDRERAQRRCRGHDRPAGGATKFINPRKRPERSRRAAS
jgi:hypothetical protein